MLKHRTLSAAVFAVVVGALVGGLYGRSALATQDRVAERYKVFTSALSAIEAQYVEKVESDRVVYSAIQGMLQTLDPHSNFLDPRTYLQLRERQEGRYYGLGITIQVLDGDITVVSLFEGSPAYKRGIRRGDVIARIKGEDTKGWTSDQAVSQLRGPKGSTVDISLRRKGYDQLINLAVERDEISIPTIQGVFMLDAKTGYVRLRDFSETTDRDLGRAIEALTAKGMKQLLLDLRDNPGGPLDQAIRVSNRFLPRGDLIVYTRGRIANSDQDYRGERGPLGRDAADRRAGEPQQRERGRNRRRLAAGPRPRPGGRGEHLRQGAGAVHLPGQPGRRARADHGPLLHAERAPHPAPVGRHVRRVPDLLAARPGRRAPPATTRRR